MARVDYTSAENIHDMTTRQLRDYIYVKSREAQERLDSVVLEDTSKAFRDAASYITNNRGKVRKSTSNMTKAEMREYAYDLRQFESLDTTSGFAKSIEWKENRQKYESFMQNRIKDGDKYWSKYLTKKGNISKKGYEDYKEFIRFLQAVENVQQEYGYRQIKQYGLEIMSAKDKAARREVVSKMLLEVYEESRGKGMTQSELIDVFQKRMHDYDERKAASSGKAPTVHAKTQKSHNTIKTGKARKMKEHGRVQK